MEKVAEESGTFEAVSGTTAHRRADAPPPAPNVPRAPSPADAETERIPKAPFAMPRFVGRPRDPEGDQPQLSRLTLSRERRRRRFRAAGRVMTAIIAVIALTGTGVVWAYLRSTDSGFEQVSALDEESADVLDPIGQTGDETYLIVGTDTRAGQNSSIGAGSIDDAAGARSDTVMLVNIPADRSRVVAVSFPRDLDVTRPSCEAWDNDTATYTGEIYPSADNDKLNATYALGGPKCLVKVIQKISGLKIGHFVGMDFSGFESMVNEIGGVQVCTSTPLIDDELGTVLANPGKQNINGKTALDYVRARKVEAEGNGDYGRIKRQQRFLASLLRGVLSNKVLLDPGKLNGFINAFTRDTFVEKVTTKDLLTLGKSLRNVDAGAVTFLTVPTSGTTEWGNEIPRTDDIHAIFNAIIDDKPLPGEERAPAVNSTTSSTKSTPSSSAAPKPKQTAVEPESVTLQVSNASGVSGVAASAASDLGSYGFQIYQVGNYSAGTATATEVHFSPGHEREAATVASAIPGAVIVKETGLGSIVELVIGSDYDGATMAPTSAGRELSEATLTPATSTGESSSTYGSAPTTTELPSDLDVTNAADDKCA